MYINYIKQKLGNVVKILKAYTAFTYIIFRNHILVILYQPEIYSHVRIHTCMHSHNFYKISKKFSINLHRLIYYSVYTI
jgi:hypothetical protein